MEEVVSEKTVHRFQGGERESTCVTSNRATSLIGLGSVESFSESASKEEEQPGEFCIETETETETSKKVIDKEAAEKDLERSAVEVKDVELKFGDDKRQEQDEDVDEESEIDAVEEDLAELVQVDSDEIKEKKKTLKKKFSKKKDEPLLGGSNPTKDELNFYNFFNFFTSTHFNWRNFVLLFCSVLASSGKLTWAFLPSALPIFFSFMYVNLLRYSLTTAVNVFQGVRHYRAIEDSCDCKAFFDQSMSFLTSHILIPLALIFYKPWDSMVQILFHFRSFQTRWKHALEYFGNHPLDSKMNSIEKLYESGFPRNRNVLIGFHVAPEKLTLSQVNELTTRKIIQQHPKFRAVMKKRSELLGGSYFQMLNVDTNTNTNTNTQQKKTSPCWRSNRGSIDIKNHVQRIDVKVEANADVKVCLSDVLSRYQKLKFRKDSPPWDLLLINFHAVSTAQCPHSPFTHSHSVKQEKSEGVIEADCTLFHKSVIAMRCSKSVIDAEAMVLLLISFFHDRLQSKVISETASLRSSARYFFSYSRRFVSSIFSLPSEITRVLTTLPAPNLYQLSNEKDNLIETIPMNGRKILTQVLFVRNEVVDFICKGIDEELREFSTHTRTLGHTLGHTPQFEPLNLFTLVIVQACDDLLHGRGPYILGDLLKHPLPISTIKKNRVDFVPLNFYEKLPVLFCLSSRDKQTVKLDNNYSTYTLRKFPLSQRDGADSKTMMDLLNLPDPISSLALIRSTLHLFTKKLARDILLGSITKSSSIAITFVDITPQINGMNEKTQEKTNAESHTETHTEEQRAFDQVVGVYSSGPGYVGTSFSIVRHQEFSTITGFVDQASLSPLLFLKRESSSPDSEMTTKLLIGLISEKIERLEQRFLLRAKQD